MIRRRAAVLGLVLLVLAGCGRKGNPVAPERRVPLPPSDLSATVRAGEIALSWRNPNRRADNSRMRDLEAVRLFRAADTGAGEPKPAILSGDRVVGYAGMAEIRISSPAPAVIDGPQVRFADRADLKDGQRYTYVVTATDSQGRTSAPSKRLSVMFITAPKPAANLAGTAGDRQVQLAWEPPAGLADGRPLAGTITYQVLRAASADAAPAPVTTAPIAGTRHTDANLDNGQTYYYAVRAVRADAGGTALGEPSAPIALTPRDTTPPSPPTGLVTIAAGDSVRLAWQASPEPDVAGYIIYRGGPRGEPARVGSVRAPTTVFADRDVPPGTYRYAVTAFDTAPAPNESARSAEVTVTLP